MPAASSWVNARLKWETTDMSQADIAQELGVTRQAVHKRRKEENWCKHLVDNSEAFECVPTPKSGSRLGLRSENNIAQLINVYALSGSKTHACKVIGIDQKTLQNWCKESAELSRKLSSSRAAFLVNQQRKIADSTDWKAAKEILARAPETKEQWGDNNAEKGPSIVLNIIRDEVVIAQ